MGTRENILSADEMKSRYKCPSCDKHLSIGLGRSSIFVIWCPHGPCQSKAANDGQEGHSEKEAFAKLVAAVEQEVEERMSQL